MSRWLRQLWAAQGITEAEDGTTGVGVTTAGEPGCYIVEKHLSRFVEGEDPRNVERIYDCMWRSTINYGRKGLPLQAISAVDLALWDLRARSRGRMIPVGVTMQTIVY